MNVKEVFAQLLRYFPEDDNTKLYKTISDYSLACLAAGDFAEAEKYADITINRDGDNSRIISARKIKLYVKLGCRNDEQFIHAEKFNRDMPEYLELIAVCSDDKVKLNKILNLAKRNEETVAEERRRRQGEERRRQEEERRRREEEEKRRQEEEKRKAYQQEVKAKCRVYFIWFCVFTCAGLILFMTGVILWGAYGDSMPYRSPLPWLIFLISIGLFMAAVVFLVLCRRTVKNSRLG